MKLDRFYPVVPSVAWIQRLIPLGVKFVQLRIKDSAADEVRREIAAARSVCARAGVQLVVNDYWQCAIEEQCDFVHLGQTDLDTADVLSLKRAHIKLGISTHDHAELERALSFDPDYVALGPIYPTMLKQMPWAPQGLARITEWKRRVGARPLVAIGGLAVERLPGVFAAGADVAAVVGDVVNSADADARVSEWILVTRNSVAAQLGPKSPPAQRGTARQPS